MTKGRPAKDGAVLNIKLSRQSFDNLSEYCEESGESKTSVVEKALALYIAEKREDAQLIQDYRLGRISFIKNK